MHEEVICEYRLMRNKIFLHVVVMWVARAHDKAKVIKAVQNIMCYWRYPQW